jgi:hemerythrin-like domain-containing protein
VLRRFYESSQGAGGAMQVYSPLVVEHDVILRMTEAIKKLLECMRESQEEIQVNFDNVIEFLCMYVDRCHHVKEEDIFFHHCDKKGIQGTDKKIMEELVAEHAWIMRTVGELIRERQEYGEAYRLARENVESKLSIVSTYYPEHMRKENEIFFPRVLKYFSHDEQYSILRQFWKFNEKILFEKYYAILDRLEARTVGTTYPPIRLSGSL